MIAGWSLVVAVTRGALLGLIGIPSSLHILVIHTKKHGHTDIQTNLADTFKVTHTGG